MNRGMTIILSLQKYNSQLYFSKGSGVDSKYERDKGTKSDRGLLY